MVMIVLLNVAFTWTMPWRTVLRSFFLGDFLLFVFPPLAIWLSL